MPFDYSQPLRTALLDALGDCPSYGYAIKKKKLQKIMSALSSLTDSVIIYSREQSTCPSLASPVITRSLSTTLNTPHLTGYSRRVTSGPS